jgi:hypothetical protein
MQPTPDMPGYECPMVVFAKDQPEYIPLPAWRGPDGTVVSRWKLSWRERLAVFFGGHLWLTVLTFNHPLQPVKIAASCPLRQTSHSLSFHGTQPAHSSGSDGRSPEHQSSQQTERTEYADKIKS